MAVSEPLIRERVLAPGRFFVLPPARLRIESADGEVVRWEVFFGHLLDRAATRRQQTFDAWHVYLDGPHGTASTPLISVRRQCDTGQWHVTRQIEVYAHQAFEASPGVIETRLARKWTSELVGSCDAEEDESELERRLSALVMQAVVGTSRLPITSLESPLTEFSLGQLGYWPSAPAADDAWTDSLSLLVAELSAGAPLSEQAKALELALRALPESRLADLTAILVDSSGERSTAGQRALLLLQTVFNTAALSPYTGFPERLVDLVEQLAAADSFGARAAVDLLGQMLRQLCRHLSAFDLALFHNFGANYPDALFLDRLLKAYLRLLAGQPQLASGTAGRLARRALRQAALIRRHYEGLRVPDAPTSMGENARVLPEPLVRVPEEQIMEPGKRRRVLFADEPTESLFDEANRVALQASLADLDDPRELRELGQGLFLDRPLGALKQSGEVDRTPLLSYEAVSRLLAVRRLAALKSAGWIDQERHNRLKAALPAAIPPGVAAAELNVPERPGVVSLNDANKAAADFVVLRTTRGSLDALLALYDWRPLAEVHPHLSRFLHEDRQALLVAARELEPGSPVFLRLFRGSELQMELGFPLAASTMSPYREQAGVEIVPRLEVLRARDEAGRLLERPQIWITAR